MGGPSKYNVVLWSAMTVVAVALVYWTLMGKRVGPSSVDMDKLSGTGSSPSTHVSGPKDPQGISPDHLEDRKETDPGESLVSTEAKIEPSSGERDVGSADAKKPAPPFQDYGTFQPIKAGSDARTKWIAEGIRKGEPERFSLLFPPKDEDWSLESFRQNPEPWLNSPSPARAFKTNRPGPDVVGLSATTANLWQVKQSDEITLSVKGVPKDLHTWTSKDAGLLFDADPKRRKETGLNSVAVMSDDEGVSRVIFKAGPGVVEDCGILVGGKTSSGQVRFTMSVVKD